LRIGQIGVVAEEAEAAGLVGRDELRKEQSPEQAGEHAHREEEPRPQDTQRWGFFFRAWTFCDRARGRRTASTRRCMA
jgi:hypothetical protein